LADITAALLDIASKADWDNHMVDKVLGAEKDIRPTMPDGTDVRMSVLYTETLDLYLARPTWTTLMMGSFYASLAQEDPRKLRASLVSTAATLAGWISAIDARLAADD
jgi:hypothetical protein